MNNMSTDNVYDCDSFIDKIYFLHFRYKNGRKPSNQELIEYQEKIAKKRDLFKGLSLIILILNYLIPIVIASLLFKILLPEASYDLFLSIINIVLMILISIYNFYIYKEYNTYKDFNELINGIGAFGASYNNKISAAAMIAFINKYNQIVNNSTISIEPIVKPKPR